MGAGSSTEQRSPEQPAAGSAEPAEPQPGGPAAEEEAAPREPADPAIAPADPATKLLQKNGQLSTVNGLAEQEAISLQEETLDGQEEAVIVTDVGQRESEDVSERDSNVKMAASSAAVHDLAKDGQEEMPEIIEQIPSSESNLEELAQPTESQSSDVGFKKVFKFVGFKFTVKKDKNEKSDTVQLLTVKKDESEGAEVSNGAGDHQEPSCEAGEATPKESELKQSTEQPEETLKLEQNNAEVSLPAEPDQAVEESKDEGEEKQEKEPTKSPESPTSPVASETASPFKKFFTQGWAGWRKKTSFRKPKEDELETSEKKKGQEEKGDAEESEKPEASEEQAASEAPRPLERVSEARLSAEYEKVELLPEDQMQGAPEEKAAPLATEVFDEKVEVVVAQVHVNTVERTAEEQEGAGDAAAETLPADASAQAQAAEPAEELAKPQEAGALEGDPVQQSPELSPEGKAWSAHPEGLVSEVEVLSSQERIKVQGSPLKKLFTSSGLKKLSAKKLKGKRGGDEDSGEQPPGPAESPDSTDEQKGDSSASSPEEPEEPVEKGLGEAASASPPLEAEVEEGATSDGEKKREGITPWASFKKMVTPKKRVRRPSESDREDELDKVKSATLSSTESATSELQDEARGCGGEEPRRKVDTSVSWEALICVGSSKKRARKASSSDDEGPPKAVGGEGPRPDEGTKDKEAGAEPAGAQDPEPGPGGSSPEPVGSPSEGEGVSTWESFKRLVTARKKSKSKMEDRNDEAVTGPDQAAAEAEPGREESWVSIKKLIPGRRKKRPDGKQEQAAVGAPAEVTDDDPDVPAVVPLAEYDAVEREKMEAQQAQKSAEVAAPQATAEEAEEPQAVVDGARPPADVEERSPSWISASVAEPLEEEGEDTAPSGELVEGEAATLNAAPEVTTPATEVATLPAPVVTTPEGQDPGEDAPGSEVELTSEAVTAAETTGAFCAEEATEASGAEETTDMVSAVSQLTESPDTTEEATPVQEAEGSGPNQEDLERRTQEVLQAVAEKVGDKAWLLEDRALSDNVQTAEPKMPEEAGEAPAVSPAPDLKKEMDVALEVQVQEITNLTQGEVMVHSAPESSGKAPQGTESVQSSELATTQQAETLVGVKSEIVLEQAVAPDSADTLTDSESPSTTVVSDFEALKTTQQDKIEDDNLEDREVTSGIHSQVPEMPTEMPSIVSGLQSQKENMEHSGAEVVVDHTDAVASGEMAPILSKTEGIQEAGEETKDASPVEGLEVSADTEVTLSQKRIPEVASDGQVPKEAESEQDDDIELQSQTQAVPTPGDRGMAVQVEKEKTEAESTQESEEKPKHDPDVTASEALSQQQVQTVSATLTGGEGEVSSLRESVLLAQEEMVGEEIQVQSSEASQTLTAAAVEEKKVLKKTVKISETAEILGSADAHSVLEEKPTENEALQGAEASPTGTESQVGSTPVTVPPSTGEGICADLGEDKTTAQTHGFQEGHEQVVCPEDKVRVILQEDAKAENHESLQLESESSKLVQNVIQTVVEQLVSMEETASGFQVQAPLMKAESQQPEQEMEKEESGLPASAQEETQTLSTKEESAPTTVEQTHSGITREGSEAGEVAASCADAPQLEEAISPSEDKREETETKSLQEDGSGAGLGERIEEALCGAPGEGKGGMVDLPEKQMSAMEDVGPAGVFKGPLDTNGPKLQEQEDSQEELQERKAHRESEEEIKTQTQGEMQKEERGAESEPAES